ncbi:MAG: ribonuclease-3 [Polaribacter sp.]|jgi:ribonuclease-3|tara:strand:+ start:1657 stop:2346 length:690 start_codon:yes stop_codon:yes gene_type:complete
MGIAMASNLEQLQRRLGYVFDDPELLTLALSHRSFTGPNNERMEFLGDAVLGLVVTDYLYREFSDAREGELSRMRSHIVRGESLAEVAKKLELGADILLGPGEMKSGGHRRDSILGDTVEALLGAVYLDQGIEAARDRIYDWFKSLFESALEVKPLKDSKTTLQEWLQQRGKSLPDYKLVDTGGEAHSRLFTVSCKIGAVTQEKTATASSRRRAEQMVAEQLLTELEKK